MSGRDLNRAESGGVFAWFIGNPVAVNVIMAFLILSGWMIATNLQSEVIPEIDPRTITISVSYPGATPEEVELSITRRVEQAVLGLEGIDRISSSAIENAGTVTVELNDFADAQEVKDKIETTVDQLSQFPPPDAEEPRIVITERNSTVINLAISGHVDERALRETAEQIERDLIANYDISSITLQGSRAYEISIEVPEASLRAYGLTIDQVAGAVSAASVNLSGGVLRTQSGEILLRIDEEARTAPAFESIIVASDPQGQKILLGDIATIVDGFEDAELKSTYNERRAVFLQIDKSLDEDAYEIATGVKRFLNSYKAPAGIEVQIDSDATEVISDRINLLARNAVLGLALVFVFLAFTLDLRLAFWTSLGIPISFLGGFLIFGQFVTINMVTLFGLIMVLGIVVDDAIVVGENIYEQQISGIPPKQAAINGVIGVIGPVTIGSLTTMTAFAPLLYSTGDMGQLLRPVPIVVIGVLLISMIEAFLILPAHLAHGGEWSVGPMKQARAFVHKGLFFLRDQIVLPAISFGIKFRYFTFAACLSILIVFSGIISGGHVRFIFFPIVESESVSVSLAMPIGSPFEQTDAAMQEIVAAGYEAVGGEASEIHRSVTVTVGGRSTSGFGRQRGTEIGTHLASAKIELLSAAERTVSATEIERRWRNAVGSIAGADSVTFNSTSFRTGSDISFNLSLGDNEQLLELVESVKHEFASIEGVTEIETSADIGKRQIEFFLTPDGAAAGLRVGDLARQVRQAFFGAEVQRIQRGRNEVRVYVRLPANERRSLADLSRLRIGLPDGSKVPIHTVSRIVESRSFAAIDKVDGRRIVSVSADVDKTITTPNDVNARIKSEVFPALMKAYPGLKVSTEGQARDQLKDLRALSRNLGIAGLIMFVMLASVLRSYIQPLVILAAIPFGAVGAILGHLLMGYDISFLSLFGIVALSGVVINDSIVLIDRYNAIRRSNDGSVQAVLEATRARFRPILLTTLTTFIGLAPMLTETSVQAQFLIPMATSLGFGILVGSTVVLFLVPACLIIVDDVVQLLERLRARVARKSV